MKPLRDYVLPCLPSYIVALLSMLIALGLELSFPMVTRFLVNEVFTGGDFRRFWPLIAAILIIGLGKGIFSYIKEFTFDRNCTIISTAIRKDLFAHVQTLSMDYFDNTNTGVLMSRLMSDVEAMHNLFGMTSMLMIEMSLLLIGIVACMFYLDWQLALLPLATLVIGVAISFLLEKKLDGVYSEISEANAELNTVAEENLSGVKTVRAFAREDHEILRFRKQNRRYYDANMAQTRILVQFRPICEFIGAILPVGCAVVGGLQILRGRMDAGSLVAFVAYSRSCAWPLDMMAELANEFSSAIASYKKLKAIADKTPDLTAPAEDEESPVIHGDLEFRKVSHCFDGKAVLEDISFTLPQGHTLGIMGATGSGKTTILNLLQRFYDPTEGQVLLDGRDLRQLPLTTVRRASALVMQDVFLFSDTVQENIRMGRKDQLSDDFLQECAAKAQASAFIDKLEEGYDTVIGERGVGLSGGQRQRLSIARALAQDRPILALDDATSALDTETEHDFQLVLNQLSGMSKIIIAHRISAVRHADEILYLDHGHIAERGTHEELLAKKGLYYETYMAQYPTEKGPDERAMHESPLNENSPAEHVSREKEVI